MAEGRGINDGRRMGDGGGECGNGTGEMEKGNILR